MVSRQVGGDNRRACVALRIDLGHNAAAPHRPVSTHRVENKLFGSTS
jgi:hypothetical protein